MEELRLTLLKTDNWHIELEIYNDLPYMHCSVTKWSKSVYIELIEAWILIKQELSRKGIDMVFAVSPNAKVSKFAELFGFKTIASCNVDILYTRW